MVEKETKSIDPAATKMIEKASGDGAATAFTRAETMIPCPIGSVGSCCKNCGMGPCRVPLSKGREETPEGASGMMGNVKMTAAMSARCSSICFKGERNLVTKCAYAYPASSIT